MSDFRFSIGGKGFLQPPALFPLVLIAIVFAGKSRREKLTIWRYLAGYFPITAAPILASLYHGSRTQLIVALAFLPLQIGIPFWFSWKITKVHAEEGRVLRRG